MSKLEIKPKIAICTLCINDWYLQIVKYAVKTHELYAQRHQYDFYTPNEVYDGERKIMWYKIPAILKHLGNYDFIVWLDADGHIMKPEKTIESFIAEFLPEGKDIFCAKDWNNVLNTGVMIMRNTSFTRAILVETWKHVPKDPSFHEQASLSDLYESNFMGAQSKMVIVDGNNRLDVYTYWSNYYPSRSFFMHTARCAFDPGGFMYTLDTYCPIKMGEETQEDFLDRKEWLQNMHRCRKDIDDWVGGRIGDKRESLRSIMFKKDIADRNTSFGNPY